MTFQHPASLARVRVPQAEWLEVGVTRAGQERGTVG